MQIGAALLTFSVSFCVQVQRYLCLFHDWDPRISSGLTIKIILKWCFSLLKKEIILFLLRFLVRLLWSSWREKATFSESLNLISSWSFWLVSPWRDCISCCHGCKVSNVVWSGVVAWCLLTVVTVFFFLKQEFLHRYIYICYKLLARLLTLQTRL